MLGSPISSRHNSTESVFSEAASYKSTEVKVIDTPEVEIVTSSTLVDLVGEPLLKEKIVTASKVEKQTLKRSKNKIRSRSSSIELIFQPKKEKKNLIQTKICFNKQIDGKNNNITTSTPKALRRSIRSESTSSTNKNEMIRVDYVKESLTESFKNTATKFVPQSTDFCKVMEELNVSKKSKDPKVVVNDDVKSTSTKRDKHPRLSNRIKCEDDITVSNTIEVVPSTPTLHVAEKTLVAEVLKKKIKSNKNEVKEAKRKNVDKILNIDTKRIKKDVPEKRKRGRKSPKPPTKTTEKLEKAIESLVPYDKILTVLRFSSHVQNGRPTLQEKAAIEKTKKETKKLLEELKYFHCGSCKLDITKHKWHEHWINHGGIAWIDGFETSLNLNDWEDSLRRFVNNMKTYEVSSFVCAICSEERKSAMGHLSHIIICGFDEEVVESRKKQCSTCQARMFPCNYTYHKKMCTGLVELITDVKKEEEDEVESTNILDSSGRVKRKAVQK